MWGTVIEKIFEEVFYHRSKDFHDEIRYHCMEHLQSLIFFDIEKNVKMEYLKYVARGCYDYYDSVRLKAVEIIKALVEVRTPPILPHFRVF